MNVIAEDNEQRLRKRKSRSKRMSGSFSRSRSDRWSSETTRYSTEHANQLSSPTVKLNDVSKLLQNSQSINIRRVSISFTHTRMHALFILIETYIYSYGKKI